MTTDLKTHNQVDKSTIDDLIAAARDSGDSVRRFVIVFDATSSMGPWWSMATDAVKQAITEIKSRTAFQVAVQVVAYRDITVDHEPLVISDLTDDEFYLKEFTAGVHAEGGGDTPESVDIGLQQAIKSKASMVILIGDADSRPESPGWKEASELGQSGCPIHALWIDTGYQKVRTCFERLAKLSGGKAFPLNSRSNMADILTTILASDKKLMITYQATSIEGQRMQQELK